MTRSSALLGVLGVCACADGSDGTAPVVDYPSPPGAVGAGLCATVDARAGTLTFGSLPRARVTHGDPGSVRLAGIYGDQGVTVRLYNSPVMVASSSTPGKEN
jgi:hypothetical protein